MHFKDWNKSQITFKAVTESCGTSGTDETVSNVPIVVIVDYRPKRTPKATLASRTLFVQTLQHISCKHRSQIQTDPCPHIHNSQWHQNCPIQDCCHPQIMQKYERGPTRATICELSGLCQALSWWNRWWLVATTKNEIGGARLKVWIRPWWRQKWHVRVCMTHTNALYHKIDGQLTSNANLFCTVQSFKHNIWCIHKSIIDQDSMWAIVMGTLIYLCYHYGNSHLQSKYTFLTCGYPQLDNGLGHIWCNVSLVDTVQDLKHNIWTLYNTELGVRVLQ